MAGFNGAGQFSFTYNWVNDAANGIPITASRMDGQFNDAVSGFDLCLTRDGQGAATANLPMNNFKHTGAAAATTSGDYVVYNQSAASFISPNITGTVTGSAVYSGVTLSGIANASGRINFTAPGNSQVISVNPASGLTGYIDMRATNNAGSLLWGVENNVGGGLATGSEAYSSLIGSATATSLHFITADIVRATVDSAGSVLVNTITPGGWSNNAKFAVEQGASGHAMSLYATSAASDCAIYRVDNTASPFCDFRFSSTNVGSITTNGTNTTYGTTSDERLKNKLETQRDHREMIKEIWVGDVEYKADLGKPVLAIMAQQVLPHYPEAVQIPRNPETDMYGADYGRFGPLALWGVKDLYGLVENLLARIEVLESKNVASQ